LGWDEARIRDEISRYQALVDRLKSFEGDTPTARRHRRSAAPAVQAANV
jgi:hypothetical protein